MREEQVKEILIQLLKVMRKTVNSLPEESEVRKLIGPGVRAMLSALKDEKANLC